MSVVEELRKGLKEYTEKVNFTLTSTNILILVLSF